MPIVKIQNHLRRPIRAVNYSGTRSLSMLDNEVMANHELEIEVGEIGEIEYGFVLRAGEVPTKSIADFTWQSHGKKMRYRARSRQIGVRTRLFQFADPVTYRLYSTWTFVRLVAAAAAVTIIAASAGLVIATHRGSSVTRVGILPTLAATDTVLADTSTPFPTDTTTSISTDMPTATSVPTVVSLPVVVPTKKPIVPPPVIPTATFTPTPTLTPLPPPGAIVVNPGDLIGSYCGSGVIANLNFTVTDSGGRGVELVIFSQFGVYHVDTPDYHLEPGQTLNEPLHGTGFDYIHVTWHDTLNPTIVGETVVTIQCQTPK